MNKKNCLDLKKERIVQVNMKVNPAPLHLAQTVITGLVVAFSIAILGTAGHTLDVFNNQQVSLLWIPITPRAFPDPALTDFQPMVASSLASAL